MSDGESIPEGRRLDAETADHVDSASDTGSVPTDDDDDDTVEVVGTRQGKPKCPPVESSSDEESDEEPKDDGKPKDEPSPRKVFHNIANYSYDDYRDEGSEDEVVYQFQASSIFDLDAIEVEERDRQINIFDDDRFLVCKMIRPDGSKGWKCEHCNVYFGGGHHNTKALAHISLSKFSGIKHCSGNISPESLVLYKRIHTIRSEKRDVKAQTRATITRVMKDYHGTGLASLDSLPGKKQAQLKSAFEL